MAFSFSKILTYLPLLTVTYFYTNKQTGSWRLRLMPTFWKLEWATPSLTVWLCYVTEVWRWSYEVCEWSNTYTWCVVYLLVWWQRSGAATNQTTVSHLSSESTWRRSHQGLYSALLLAYLFLDRNWCHHCHHHYSHWHRIYQHCYCRWLHSFSKSDKSRSIQAKCSAFSVKSDLLRHIWDNLA